MRIRNTGDIVEEYHLDVVGDPASWCVVEPTSLRLYPGTTGSVRLSFTPPRSPDAAAGPHPFGVKIMPVENPDATMVVEGNVTVTAFVDVRAELLPPTVRGWLRGKPVLAVDNHGNTSVTAAVLATATGSGIDVDIRTPHVQIQPGRGHFSKLNVKPSRLLWLGQRASHRFTATLQPSGSPPVNVDGTYMQSALLPRWLGRLLMLLVALALVFAALWFAAKPSVRSDATAKPVSAPAGQVIAPSPTEPAATHSATPSSKPSQHQGSSAPKPAAKTAPKPATKAPAASLVPVGRWDLSNGTPSSADDDEKKHNAHGTNVTWSSGCVNFNGTSSQLVTDGPVLKTGPGQSFTVSAHVYAIQSSHDMTMVAQDGASGSAFFLQYFAANNRWAFSRSSADGGSNPTPFRAFSDNPPTWSRWTHLVGVYNGSTDRMRLYVGGIAEGTATDDSPYATGGDLTIGRAQFNGSDTNWYLGAIDNVEVFQQALTPAQVKALP